jgi:hypothetical protein
MKMKDEKSELQTILLAGKDYQDTKILYQKLLQSGEVVIFRDFWSLPASGFQNINSYQNWRHQSLDKQAHIPVANEYKARKKELANKKIDWAKGKILHLQLEKYEQKTQHPLVKFGADIYDIMTRLGIPERYEHFVELSLVLNKSPEFTMIDRPLPKLHLITERGRRKIYVEIYGDTKLEDFRSKVFTHEFKKLQSEVYDYGTIKKIGVPSLDFWEQLHKWKLEGKSHKEIYELAQKFGYPVRNTEQVKVYLNRWRKLGYTRKKKV